MPLRKHAHAGSIIASLSLMLSVPVLASEQSQYLETPAGEKPRVVITTDPELDDLNSLIRYLLYSADFRTEGLVYASSQFHWKGDGKGTEWFVEGREYDRPGLDICPCTSWRWAEGERFINDAVDAYSLAYPNLRIHEPDYPSPALLESKIRWGNVAFDGDISSDTAGSELIKSLLLDDEPAPVYLHAWGGQSTIARALLSIEEEYKDTEVWPEVRAKVIGKAIIHAFGDQDDTYATYIEPNWPEIRYREPAGGISLAYDIQSTVSEENSEYFSPAWTRTNISSKGPLGELYRVWGDGKQMVEGDIFDFFGFAGKTAEELRNEGYMVWTKIQPPGSFISEGDTPTFLNLVDNGLRGFRSESYGGWGGTLPRRSAQLQQMFGADDDSSATGSPVTDPVAPSSFYAAAQRDLAARFNWAVSPDFADANHHPQIDIVGSTSRVVKPGERVVLKAIGRDPDGDDVSIRWWHWADVSDVKARLRLNELAAGAVELTVPFETKPNETIHLIAEAMDRGSPQLTRYERVILRVAE